MKNQLERILRLIKKTGETLVVTDPNGEDAYVVLNLERYEELLGGNATAPVARAVARPEPAAHVEPKKEDLPPPAVFEPEPMIQSSKSIPDDDSGADEAQFYLEPVE